MGPLSFLGVISNTIGGEYTIVVLVKETEDGYKHDVKSKADLIKEDL